MLEVPGDLSSRGLVTCTSSDSVHSTAPGTGRRSSFNGPRSQFVAGVDSQLEEAWAALRKSLVVFRGQRVGTIATTDNSDENLNYDQVFVRDFIPSGLAFLMNRVPEIVKNFILKTLRSWEKKIDRFPGEGVLPASFKVRHDSAKNKDTIWKLIFAKLQPVGLLRSIMDSGGSSC
ncbi:Probable alkaline/neutral invertase B [Linum perenne]